MRPDIAAQFLVIDDDGECSWCKDLKTVAVCLGYIGCAADEVDSRVLRVHATHLGPEELTYLRGFTDGLQSYNTHAQGNRGCGTNGGAT